MAKGRSAISKAMPKKEKEAHVSGLASSAAKKRKKEGGVKFGQLSRKQQNDLKEYGRLIPEDFVESESENGQEDDESAPKKRLKRVVYEHELDRELEEEQEQEETMFDDEEEGSDENEDEEEGEGGEDDWEKPSAYSRLVGSLQKTSKNRAFYEKILREQQGIEDDQEVEEEEEDQDIEGDDQDDDLEEEEDESAEELEEEEEEEDQEEEDEDENKDEDEADAAEIDSSDEEVASKDQYRIHFANEQPKDFDEKISKVEQKQWATKPFEDSVLTEGVAYSVNSTGKVSLSKKIDSLESVNVKSRIIPHWKKANKHCLEGVTDKPFTPLQEKLFAQFNDYKDVLYCNRTIENAEEIRNAYLLHALNHILKTRDTVLKNNQKITKAQNENRDPGDIRDQGFTRPKVLIVLPFRNTVVDLVQTLIKLSGSEQQENKKRFFEEYSLLQQDKMDESKPADYLATFHGNIDDHFKLSIKFTRKTMKFYSGFYDSDMLIASPLALRTMIGVEGDKERDWDLLSSLEVVIFDQTNHFLMQNWDHVEHIFQYMNLIPRENHGCDISRLKSWYLDRKSGYLRQILMFSDFLTPEINSVFNKYFKNVAGKLKIKQSYEDGTIVDVLPQIQQTFTRIDAPSLSAMDDARFKYFIEKTLPTLRKSTTMQNHTLIFIPSYFDYVRIRNYMEDNNYSYGSCCEYTAMPDVSRSRTKFFQGRISFLLFTERFHFFRRYNIRGTFHVVFYGLPDHPQFYSEVVNFLGLKFNEATAAEEATFSVRALFSRYDHLRLERIVGSERAQKMCTAQKNVFLFA
ncbi:hypothetical protein VTP01DRAFT_4850 [Rhizomucor pusillus]|uniref:uncharacterized protein n=1 Tax=Rhizomucor pusillus TaxID=4840 RepID=UPI003742982B